jgi:hypothetical protein
MSPNTKPWEAELSGIHRQYSLCCRHCLCQGHDAYCTTVLVPTERVSRAVLHLTESLSKNSEVGHIRAPLHFLQGNARVFLKYAIPVYPTSPVS